MEKWREGCKSLRTVQHSTVSPLSRRARARVGLWVQGLTELLRSGEGQGSEGREVGSDGWAFGTRWNRHVVGVLGSIGKDGERTCAELLMCDVS